MQQFPKIKYHKTLAPEGELVQSAEDEQQLVAGEAGWVDTPAAFDPNYVPPPPFVPDPNAPADQPSYRPKAYPAVRYNRLGEDRSVANADEDAALDPEEWKWSPAAFADRGGVPPAGASATPRGSAPPSGGPDAAPVDEAAEKKAAEEMAENARTLHSTPVEEVKKGLDGAPAEVLARAKHLEALNPAGPRITLVKFIDSALKALDEPATQ